LDYTYQKKNSELERERKIGRNKIIR